MKFMQSTNPKKIIDIQIYKYLIAINNKYLIVYPSWVGLEYSVKIS